MIRLFSFFRKINIIYESSISGKPGGRHVISPPEGHKKVHRHDLVHK